MSEQHCPCRFPLEIIEHLPDVLRKHPKACSDINEEIIETVRNSQNQSADMSIHICFLSIKCFYRKVPDRVTSSGLVPENLSPQKNRHV